MVFYLNFFSAIFAFAAALLWFCASVVYIRSDYKGAIPAGASFLNFRGGRGPISRESDGKWIDVVATARRQGRLNAWAAGMAAIAAFLQGGGIVATMLAQPN